MEKQNDRAIIEYRGESFVRFPSANDAAVACTNRLGSACCRKVDANPRTLIEGPVPDQMSQLRAHTLSFAQPAP